MFYKFKLKQQLEDFVRSVDAGKYSECALLWSTTDWEEAGLTHVQLVVKDPASDTPYFIIIGTGILNFDNVAIKRLELNIKWSTNNFVALSKLPSIILNSTGEPVEDSLICEKLNELFQFIKNQSILTSKIRNWLTACVEEETNKLRDLVKYDDITLSVQGKDQDTFLSVTVKLNTKYSSAPSLGLVIKYGAILECSYPSQIVPEKYSLLEADTLPEGLDTPVKKQILCATDWGQFKENQAAEIHQWVAARLQDWAYSLFTP